MVPACDNAPKEFLTRTLHDPAVLKTAENVSEVEETPDGEMLAYWLLLGDRSSTIEPVPKRTPLKATKVGVSFFWIGLGVILSILGSVSVGATTLNGKGSDSFPGPLITCTDQ